MAAGLAVGPSDASLSSVIDALLNPSSGDALSDIVWQIRWPRLVLAALVGASLSVSGVIFQALLRNPLADPFILGVSGGAALGGIAMLALGATYGFGYDAVPPAAFAGAILIVDVRLLGRGLTNTPVAQLAREAEKWLLGAFAVLLSSGIPQVFATALKEYYSPYFWLKMQLILAGLVFTFTIRRKVALADEERMGKVWPKLVALVSIAIWTSAAIWARLIGLLS